MLERFFQLEAAGTTVATEVRAGAVTFLAMSYILFVNPQILSQAGLPAADVATATALAAAAACFLMGLVANYPVALAPGMGLNAYFTFGVVLGMGIPWQVALAAVFVEGLLFLVLALTGVRSALLRAIPEPIKLATMTGIGLFLAVIGLQGSGWIAAHPETLVTLGDLHRPEPLLALAGLCLIGALQSRRVRGAVLIAVVGISFAAWGLGIAAPPEALLQLPALPRETLLALDFSGLLTGKLFAVVAAFLFVDLFDTAGTLLGVGRLAGLTDARGDLPKANRAFAADAVGTSFGAALGTSTVTSYVESATGIEEGGRTGLTAVVVGGFFLLALFFTPVFVAVPAAATAPALVAVGALMMQGAARIEWRRAEDALPAFLTAVAMPLTYSIANGISLGLAAHVGIRLLSGRAREVHPALWLLVPLLGLFYAFK